MSTSHKDCLLYTSDAADEGLGVDLESRLEAQAKEYIQLESDAAKSYAAAA